MRSLSTFWANLKIVGAVPPSPRRWPMLARMAGAYLKVALLDRRPFRFFDVALGYACNLSCVHCSAAELVRPRSQPLTHEEYRRFVREAMGCGCTVFHFTGGEPLLRKDLFELIRIFRPAWNMISIQTNGTLLTEEKVDRLHDAGVRSLCISLDSADPAEHDVFRGKRGAFASALAGLDRAIEKGFSCAVVFCVSHQTLRGESTLRLVRLIGERGVNGFITLAVPIGRWAGREDVMLTPEDRRYLNDLMREHPFLRTDFESNWKEQGCPAMREKAYLSPYGDVLPCPFIQVSYGNIRREPLRVILQRGREAPEFGHYPPVCRAAEDVG
ncbi:MAG: radical SAM protein, partial [Planctomycetota bacterium]